jgi:hypothetical protein
MQVDAPTLFGAGSRGVEMETGVNRGNRLEICKQVSTPNLRAYRMFSHTTENAEV